MNEAAILEGEIIYSKPYYKLQIEAVEVFDVYSKFINWVSGEFDLYLQDTSRGIKIYYPNGWFSIKKSDCVHENIDMKITVVSKSKTGCQKKHSQLVSIYNQINSLLCKSDLKSKQY
ncbi:hypothetical protein GSB9_01056 [Flavobacteriaceae bacterium GSB9]|nr:hypothetical protein GSB9_01056 [Flavobacteriaceae bacterium GSB9]